tara:strand:- start:355 stop:819 length:465 start_codon:yes stop_codon:yes gene_type:complete
MKIILILMFFSLKLYSQINTDMSEIRLLYVKSASEYKSCLKLDSITKQFSKDKFPILYSYNISSSILSCNHIKNPIKKFAIFKQKSKDLDNIIIENPNSIEIRFLRYMLQSNAPKFLGYDTKIDSDYNFVLDNLNRVDTSLKEFIYSLINKQKI